jgi:hypothetical protein
MTKHSATAEIVAAALAETFSRLDACFQLPADQLGFRPQRPGAWSVAEHLEHVCLANHFLLLTIEKGCAKALKRSAQGGFPVEESDLTLLSPIASPGAFEWQPPEHMLPTGSRDPAWVRAQLRRQLESCLGLLTGMPKGEGSLCRIRMSVHGLGRLDMSQWIYFLVQHARYHLALIEKMPAA